MVSLFKLQKECIACYSWWYGNDDSRRFVPSEDQFSPSELYFTDQNAGLWHLKNSKATYCSRNNVMFTLVNLKTFSFHWTNRNKIETMPIRNIHSEFYGLSRVNKTLPWLGLRHLGVWYLDSEWLHTIGKDVLRVCLLFVQTRFQ